MSQVELHGAFVWTCEDCGRDCFERAIEGNLDEAAMNADDNQIHAELVAPEWREVDGMMLADVLVQRILMAPRFVTCSHCQASFSTEVPSIIDDEETAP